MVEVRGEKNWTKKVNEWIGVSIKQKHTKKKKKHWKKIKTETYKIAYHISDTCDKPYTITVLISREQCVTCYSLTCCQWNACKIKLVFNR